MKRAASSFAARLELDRLFGIDCYYVDRSGGASQEPDALSTVRQEALVCTRCALSRARTQVVFGEGSVPAQLMLIGEGPGHEEDLQGRPFVGEAGMLLNKILAAMGLRRESVYIANVVKCRPPHNRTPEPDEIQACHGYLERQIAAVQPRVICALGRCAAQALLGTQYSISEIRGSLFEVRGIKIIPTFHPAYLLRSPHAKKLVWQDMKKVMSFLV